MTAETYTKIIDLIKREVVLSIGCTEPMAVSLCVAKACETLGSVPQKVSVALSANIFKNAMGVGIPNSGMTGLPIAVALGVVAGRSEYGLEVLRDVTKEDVEHAKAFRRLNRLFSSPTRATIFSSSRSLSRRAMTLPR